MPRVRRRVQFGFAGKSKDYLERPIETLLAGSVGTRNMLEVARRDAAVFVQASTSESYGDPLVHPQPETYWGQCQSSGSSGRL